MAIGKIKRINERGFGFVAMDGSSQDVFFHAKELQEGVFEDLREGDTLEFEVMDTPKGPQARNVRRADDSATGSTAQASDSTDDTSDETSSE